MVLEAALSFLADGLFLAAGLFLNTGFGFVDDQRDDGFFLTERFVIGLGLGATLAAARVPLAMAGLAAGLRRSAALAADITLGLALPTGRAGRAGRRLEAAPVPLGRFTVGRRLAGW